MTIRCASRNTIYLDSGVKPQNDAYEKVRNINLNNVYEIETVIQRVACGLCPCRILRFTWIHSGACPGPAKSSDFVGGVPRIRVIGLARSAHICPCGAMGTGLRRYDGIKKALSSLCNRHPALRAPRPRPRGIVKFRGWFPEGNFIPRRERSEFSSCGGVPRSGEVVFFYNITNSQDHPGTSCHPSTGGELWPGAFFISRHPGVGRGPLPRRDK